MNPRPLNYRQLAWSFVTILFAISLILSFTTAYNYTEIAKARVLLDIDMDASYSIQEDIDGNMQSVNVTIDFNINNPSKKNLNIWILNYKGWLRDFSMEDGTDTSRWNVDGKLQVGETEERYYPIFSASYSFDNPQVIVGAGETLTITKYLELNLDVDPIIMNNAVSIYNYSKDTGQDVQWYGYSSAIIFIQDIPSYSGQDKDANVIRRYQGFDLTPGVGGIG